jgi:hypothetical protein
MTRLESRALGISTGALFDHPPDGQNSLSYTPVIVLQAGGWSLMPSPSDCPAPREGDKVEEASRAELPGAVRE